MKHTRVRTRTQMGNHATADRINVHSSVSTQQRIASTHAPSATAREIAYRLVTDSTREPLDLEALTDYEIVVGASIADDYLAGRPCVLDALLANTEEDTETARPTPVPELVSSAWLGLSAKQRDAMWLYTDQELDYEQIAAHMRTTPQEALELLGRAYAALSSAISLSGKIDRRTADQH